MREEIITKAGEIITQKAGGGNDGHCTFALIDTDGYPTASAISISKADNNN